MTFRVYNFFTHTQGRSSVTENKFRSLFAFVFTEPKTACTTLWPMLPSWRCRPWWPLNPNTSWLQETPWRRPRPSVSGKTSPTTPNQYSVPLCSAAGAHCVPEQLAEAEEIIRKVVKGLLNEIYQHSFCLHKQFNISYRIFWVISNIIPNPENMPWLIDVCTHLSFCEHCSEASAAAFAFACQMRHLTRSQHLVVTLAQRTFLTGKQLSHWS